MNPKRPPGVDIQRSIDIGAPPIEVFDLFSDLRNWVWWNLNNRNDRTIKQTYGENPSDAGATSAWISRRGAGHIEVVSATEPSELLVLVHFDRPFEFCNQNRFKLVPAVLGTTVTWSMQGPKPWLARVMGRFVNMNRVMAKHFDGGLAAMKAVSERL